MIFLTFLKLKVQQIPVIKFPIQFCVQFYYQSGSLKNYYFGQGAINK